MKLKLASLFLLFTNERHVFVGNDAKLRYKLSRLSPVWAAGLIAKKMAGLLVDQRLSQRFSGYVLDAFAQFAKRKS